MKIYIVLERDVHDAVHDVQAFFTKEEAVGYVKGMGGELPNPLTEDTDLQILEVEMTTSEAAQKLIKDRAKWLTKIGDAGTPAKPG
jgi:hypothetical protein